MTAAGDKPVDHDDYPDAYIRGILRAVRTIAMVGASPRWNRPSYFAMKYLQEKGYRVIPVNPRAAGGEILGETVYSGLAEIPGRIDMVDVFRSSEDAGPIVDEAIAVAKEKSIQVIWMQLGVRNDEAAGTAEAAGLKVVMDRCPKIEYGRLHAELSWGGFNSRVISAKRRKVRIG
jgi:predicted CoA-binding protein